VWNDCQETVGKLRVHLLFFEVIFGNIFMGLRLLYFEVYGYDSIRDIDGRNGKSGGRVLFTGLGT